MITHSKLNNLEHSTTQFQIFLSIFESRLRLSYEQEEIPCYSCLPKQQIIFSHRKKFWLSVVSLGLICLSTVPGNHPQHMASTSQLKMASQAPAITSRCARGRRGGIALSLQGFPRSFMHFCLYPARQKLITWQPQDTGK